MRQHRFYINQDLSKVFTMKPSVFTYEEEKGRNLVNQWKNVFRYKQGDQVLLFDGKSEYQAEIIDIKNDVKFVLKEKMRELEEKKSNVYLALSILKGEHTEMVIEKATELGVSGVILVQTDRVIKKGANLERLQKIAIEASEQSGRIDVPEIKIVESLEELLNSKDFDQKVVLDMGGEKISNKKEGKTLLFVGPEGGWSDAERELFKNIETISISENVLRAETAAIVGVAILVT